MLFRLNVSPFTVISTEYRVPCHFDRVPCPLSFRPSEASGEILSHYYVYILTNWDNSVIYVGMTNDLHRRLNEHRHGTVGGFTKRYNVHKLVYFEQTEDVRVAIEREKQLKKWRRAKKDALVASMNPDWRDLSLNWE